MWGGSGEDPIYGEAGDDSINGGYDWDTIFGGDGCDTIEVIDGGDVVWLGDCDGTTGTMKNNLNIEGTGDDTENFVVVIDFWLESAKPFNEICLHVSENQENPSAPRCKPETSGLGNAYQRENNDGICVDATEIADPEQLYNELDPKTMNQDTSQELVTVGTGLRLNQLATTMRNSLSAWEFGSVIQRQRSTLAITVLELEAVITLVVHTQAMVTEHEEIESAYTAHC